MANDLERRHETETTTVIMVKITINFLQWQCMEKQTSIGVNVEIKSDHIQDNNFVAQVLYNYYMHTPRNKRKLIGKLLKFTNT